ncbi:MAG TPA: secondary thiamine-phosphate synthase enzyme YjbQ [Vicinamibacteria bacterium]|jgi:secondary thiamine-phosphate synthase enzyme|nr:secondary thiamine-phosphate synthase enzyme YjbQ [Vicinamibacteria bacterium]
METSGTVEAGERWPGREARDIRGTEIDMGVAVGRVRIRTVEPVGVTDLTARVESFLDAVGLEAGWVNVQTRHTTTGICVNENEPLLVGDLLALLERLAPRGAGYAHDELHLRPGVDHNEPRNGHAHAKALLLRTAETLNVAHGRLQLGRWQRVLLVELDGPREREVSLLAMGERRR